MFFRKALQIAILFLMSCGQPMVDLNELETFFRGREVLFDNDLSNNCQYTMRKTTNGLEIKHKLILDYKEFYSYHDFEITEKFELGEMSNYFEIGRFKVIGQANRTYMFFWINALY